MIILATGIIPLLVGALWYGPYMFNDAWMKEAGMSMDTIQGANMTKIFGFSLLFGIMLALALFPMVIHQQGVASVLMNLVETDPQAKQDLADFLAKYGTEFRTFKHGVFHGALTGIFLFLPILGTNALFERKSWKYIFINVGYWTVSAMIMGGIISAFA